MVFWLYIFSDLTVDLINEETVEVISTQPDDVKLSEEKLESLEDADLGDCTEDELPQAKGKKKKTTKKKKKSTTANVNQDSDKKKKRKTKKTKKS